MRRVIAVLFTLIFTATAIAAEHEKSSLWFDSAKKMSSAQLAGTEISKLKNYRILQSSPLQLKSLLNSAPERALKDEGVLIDLPLPNNKFVRFRMFSDTIMEPELAAKFPSIKTYWGYDESNPRNRGRFDITENGFHGMFSYNGA